MFVGDSPSDNDKTGEDMKKILLSILTFLITTAAHAESMRCNGDLIQLGDMKAEVIAECGEPIMRDSFCRPVAKGAQIQAVQSGNQNVQNNIAVQTCEDVDVWTYHPAKGQFVTHLFFVEGELQEMKYGDRVK